MKKLLLALCLAVTSSGLAVAEDQEKRNEGPSPSATSAKPLTVFGKVSNDGKIFVTDIDTEWSVSNAEALKGYEGRMASIKCFVDSERNRIHVISVKATGIKYASRQSDSAFRR